MLYILDNRNRGPAPPTTNNHPEARIPAQPPRSNYQNNHGTIDSSSHHRYQSHSMPNRFDFFVIK